ncbi:MAG: TDT family transporter [Pyramidobacter sp.]|jgi:exfoliative toxin A/B
MGRILKRVPLPVCGTALGLAALGNLLQSSSEALRLLCVAASGVLVLMFLFRCIVYPSALAEDMKNPVTASVSGTFSMTLMLLAASLKPAAGAGALYLWYGAVGLHVLLIVYFTFRFILKLKMQSVFASYYIVYVGIAVASVSAPAFGTQNIGAAAFWFGFATFLPLLVLVTVRHVKYPEIPAPARPLICIYAAPASLCAAAYVQSVSPKSLAFLMGIYILSAALFLFALVQLLKYIRQPFYPSWAAFTFPFVITATASKMTMACAAKLGSPQPWLQPVVTAETVLAAVLVLYTLCRFMAFIFLPAQPQK